jgi:hypothetical protein
VSALLYRWQPGGRHGLSDQTAWLNQRSVQDCASRRRRCFCCHEEHVSRVNGLVKKLFQASASIRI